MKILYITTIGGTMRFFQSFIQKLIEQGYTVDIACSQTDKVQNCYRDWDCNIYPLSCSRSPLDKGNLAAIKQIQKIVTENHYDIVHCHTPIVAACTRLACRKIRKQGAKVFYTAHGFHFYKGAPLKNWLLYYPVEKMCAHWTDVLITINQEDYARAQRKMKAQKVVYVPGVGIDLQKFGNITVDRCQKRQELGIPEDATLLLSVGELNENKNHETVIRAIKDLDVYYIIAGKGGRQEYLQSLIGELGLTDRVKLLGFRTDIHELNNAADIFAFPSYREGLSVALMEAMASGLPVTCSKIRGNTDLIDKNGGELFAPGSVNDCTTAIKTIIDRDWNKIGQYNANKIQNFEINHINQIMKELYEI